MTTLDVAIIGAGPAGLAAATLCAEHGLSTSLYDEQAWPGGQIYRGIGDSPLRRPEILGDDYWQGATLLRSFANSGTRYLPGASVWSVERGDDGTFSLGMTIGPPEARSAISVVARTVILATGALERPFPVPGWTRPGVMGAGGAQALLKTAGVVPQGRTVIAGCGPLVWLLAWQYLRAGVPIAALLDTTPRGRALAAARHFPDFLRSPYFTKGLALTREVRSGVRVIDHVLSLAVEGDAQSQAATSVRYTRAGGASAAIGVDQVLLHQGVVPDVALASAAGAALAWNPLQACFEPDVDAWGGTSLPGLYVAGDGGGIAGALAAESRGRLAALAVANALGRIDGRARDTAAREHRRTLGVALRGRRFLDTFYRPADAFRLPEGDTLVCRCEEVGAATVRGLAREGCAGPNQMKAYSRCGMGPCQGRFCGLTVTELIASEQHRDPAEVGHARMRWPVRPLALAELASLPVTAEARRAVEG